MTAPGEGVPEGGYSVSNLAELQALDEAAVLRKLRQPIDRAWGDVNKNFLTRIDEWGQEKIVKPLQQIFAGLRPPGWERVADAFQDGQLKLTSRLDLLSPLLDYGSAYMDSVGGFLKFGQNYGVMPFTNQIGPMRGCDIQDGGIRLLDAGLWDIRCQLTFGANALGVGNGRVEWSVKVYDPGGGLYSEQRAIEGNQWAKTSVVVSSVVVPEPGYLVKAEIAWIHGSREIYGGPLNNRLVVQHISRTVDVGHTGAESSYRPDSSGD